MADTESPSTLYELLYCFFPPDKKIRISYDNGCQFLAFALNRDPQWAGQLRVMIDELHHHGHKACASSFSTGTKQLLPCEHILVGVGHERRDLASKINNLVLLSRGAQ